MERLQLQLQECEAKKKDLEQEVAECEKKLTRAERLIAIAEPVDSALH